MNAMTENDLAIVDNTVTNQDNNTDIQVFVCEYQFRQSGTWHKGIRIQVDSTKTDKIIDLKGNIVKDVYTVINCFNEGCFKTFIK